MIAVHQQPSLQARYIQRALQQGRGGCMPVHGWGDILTHSVECAIRRAEQDECLVRRYLSQQAWGHQGACVAPLNADDVERLLSEATAWAETLP